VLIFHDRTPPTAIRRRGCSRAQRIGGLCSPVAAQAATVRNQSRHRVGNFPQWPASVQPYAPPSRPASQVRGWRHR